MNNAARIGGKRRIYEDTDSLVRRFAALWVAAWMGMTVLIQLLTLVTFDSTASLTLAPVSYTHLTTAPSACADNSRSGRFISRAASLRKYDASSGMSWRISRSAGVRRRTTFRR